MRLWQLKDLNSNKLGNGYAARFHLSWKDTAPLGFKETQLWLMSDTTNIPDDIWEN